MKKILDIKNKFKNIFNFLIPFPRINPEGACVFRLKSQHDTPVILRTKSEESLRCYRSAQRQSSTDCRFRTGFAFSLIELMISLVTVAVIFAIFAPIVTKHINFDKLRIGAGGSAGVFNKNCITQFGNKCALCDSSMCIACNLSSTPENPDEYLDYAQCKYKKCNTKFTNCLACTKDKCTLCNEGYYINNKQCTPCPDNKTCNGKNICPTHCIECSNENDCITCEPGYVKRNNQCEEWSCLGDENFMTIGNLCVTKKNMGDSDMLPITSSVEVVPSSARCSYSSYILGRCCWKLSSSSSSCDSANGDYSGCTRTVCNWPAANKICANFNLGGYKWRLPERDEMENWASTYSKGLGNDGLQLCDGYSGYSSSRCNRIYDCDYIDYEGDSITGICYPYYVPCTYTSGTYNYRYLQKGLFNTSSTSYPSSVRCVTDYTCADGYYKSGSKCKKCGVANCKECTNSTDCTTCLPGYIKNDNRCEDACNNENFMTIGSLCVTRRNLGDSAPETTDLTIPAEANVSFSTICSPSSYNCCLSRTANQCNSSNGDYSGCKRTICNWQAANSICSLFSYANLEWRLPSITELDTLDADTYSKGLGNEGLMFCDRYSGNSSSQCYYSSESASSREHHIWSSTKHSTSYYYKSLENGVYSSDYKGGTLKSSFRCVAELKSSVAGCKTYSPSGTCTACISGYYLNGSSCVSCNNAISNCAKCTNSNTCTTCKDGYYLNDSGTCSQCGDGCQICTSASNCVQCKRYYYLANNNTCKSCEKLGCDGGYHSGCWECTSSACTSCGPCTTLSGGSCVLKSEYAGKARLCESYADIVLSPPVQHCASYDSNGFCSACESGYTLFNKYQSDTICGISYPNSYKHCCPNSCGSRGCTVALDSVDGIHALGCI